MQEKTGWMAFDALDSMPDSLISEWDGNPSYPLSTRV
jgi:hypothetical protein